MWDCCSGDPQASTKLQRINYKDSIQFVLCWLSGEIIGPKQGFRQRGQDLFFALKYQTGLHFPAGHDVRRVSVTGQWAGMWELRIKLTALRTSAVLTIESSVDSDMSTIYHRQVNQDARY